jgi:hypothetical protein
LTDRAQQVAAGTQPRESIRARERTNDATFGGVGTGRQELPDLPATGMPLDRPLAATDRCLYDTIPAGCVGRQCGEEALLSVYRRRRDARKVAREIHFYAAEGTGMIAVFPIEVWREDDEVHVVFDREFQARMVLGRQANCEFYLEKVRYAAAMVSHNAFIQACTRSKPLRTSVLPLYWRHIWP